MRIALIDVDGHNFPNLPLMKLSAWHKNQGYTVDWYVWSFDCKKEWEEKRDGNIELHNNSG